MDITEYTTEQLKAELKRRAELKRQQRQTIPHCRDCKHLVEEPKHWWVSRTCAVRTFKRKGRECHYMVQLGQKACDKYERMEEQQ